MKDFMFKKFLDVYVGSWFIHIIMYTIGCIIVDFGLGITSVWGSFTVSMVSCVFLLITKTYDKWLEYLYNENGFEKIKLKLMKHLEG